MFFKFILYSLIFYFLFKLFRWFFRPSANKTKADPKVRTQRAKSESIRQEDIIEASFEEIKTEENR